MTVLDTARRISALVALPVTLVAAMSSAVAADVTLQINNIESSEGNLRIAIYDQQSRFDEGMPYKSISQPAVKGKVEIALTDLPEGQYGVMLFHDINGNEKLDRNLIGMPKEPWSASLQGRSIMGPPGWFDINFKIPDVGNFIVIDMR